MILAWSGVTPTGGKLRAYICPKCFSTRYIGQTKDPTYQLIHKINQAFMNVYTGGGRDTSNTRRLRNMGGHQPTGFLP